MNDRLKPESSDDEGRGENTQSRELGYYANKNKSNRQSDDLNAS
jgi:hypothetical protein